MKNALILHGTEAGPQDNWFSWLKKELESRHWQVWLPKLPQADKPNLKRYNRFLLSQNWQFNQDSVIIGHSSGAVAILGLLQALPKRTQVNTCILVGTFNDDLGWKELDELFTEPFDWGKIKTKAKKFIFIHSDDDPFCPLEHAKFQAEKLNGKLIIKKGQKHFSISPGGPKYKKFPFLLGLLT
jgi:predicted alpha/beta hydrolase family esterase